MFGLTVHLQSLHISETISHPKDKIRIHILTLPENSRQSLTFNSKKIENTNYFFRLNISNETKKLVFIFEKKNFLQNNPIIASKVITFNNFPNSPFDTRNLEVKTLDIYEPILGQNKNHKVVGKMTIQFSLSEQLSIKLKKNVHSRSHKKDDFSHIESSFKNKYQNNCILLDSENVN